MDRHIDLNHAYCQALWHARLCDAVCTPLGVHTFKQCSLGPCMLESSTLRNATSMLTHSCVHVNVHAWESACMRAGASASMTADRRRCC
jgi:hypothetical protein